MNERLQEGIKGAVMLLEILLGQREPPRGLVDMQWVLNLLRDGIAVAQDEQKAGQDEIDRLQKLLNNTRDSAATLIDAIAAPPLGRDFPAIWEQACIAFGRAGAKAMLLDPHNEVRIAAEEILKAVRFVHEHSKNYGGKWPHLERAEVALRNALQHPLIKLDSYNLGWSRRNAALEAWDHSSGAMVWCNSAGVWSYDGEGHRGVASPSARTATRGEAMARALGWKPPPDELGAEIAKLREQLAERTAERDAYNASATSNPKRIEELDAQLANLRRESERRRLQLECVRSLAMGGSDVFAAEYQTEALAAVRGLREQLVECRSYGGDPDGRLRSAARELTTLMESWQGDMPEDVEAAWGQLCSTLTAKPHARAPAVDHLHPNGKCSCAGERTCLWCQRDEQHEQLANALGIVKYEETSWQQLIDRVTQTTENWTKLALESVKRGDLLYSAREVCKRHGFPGAGGGIALSDWLDQKLSSTLDELLGRVDALPIGEVRHVQLEHVETRDGAWVQVTVTLTDVPESRERSFLHDTLVGALRCATEGVDEWLEELNSENDESDAKREAAKVAGSAARKLLTREHGVELWDAINEYMRACGGQIGKLSKEREAAVVRVERAVVAALNEEPADAGA